MRLASITSLALAMAATPAPAADLPTTIAAGVAASATAAALATQPRLSTADLSNNTSLPLLAGSLPTPGSVDYGSCSGVSWFGGPANCPSGYVFVGANRRGSDSGEWNSFTCCRLN
ncbi:MAG: hypothetical protein FHP92_12890 [Denitromonas halophila]|nr:MAG: hypothetical protein FHP92_12890 [Denitromonas halophila]